MQTFLYSKLLAKTRCYKSEQKHWTKDSTALLEMRDNRCSGKNEPFFKRKQTNQDLFLYENKQVMPFHVKMKPYKWQIHCVSESQEGVIRLSQRES